MKPNILFSFLLFSLFFSMHFPIAQEKGIPQKPSPVSDTWACILGKYSHDKDCFLVLENQGKLFLLQNSVYYELEEVEEAKQNRQSHASLQFLATFSESKEKQENGRKTVLVSFFPNLSPPECEILGIHYKKEDRQRLHFQPMATVEEVKKNALSCKPPIEEGEFFKPNLVDISLLDSTIHLDIRYATSENFVGMPVYENAKAFLQKPAAQALVRVHEKLKEFGYGIVIWDAYRPWYITKIFWDITPQDKKDFVADPKKGSRHNRGMAVDVSLYDLSTGKLVEMPSDYDDFSEAALPDYPGSTSLARWHRNLLIQWMQSEGFSIYAWEWWHFDFQGWKQYPILNLSFAELEHNRPGQE